MPRADPDALAYTLAQAADLCGVSKELLRRAIKCGDLQCKRTFVDPDGEVGGKMLILRKHLEEWLEDLPDDMWGPAEYVPRAVRGSGLTPRSAARHRSSR